MSGRRPAVALVPLVGAGAAAVVLALVAAAAGGASAPLPLGDPGALVRVGLPVVKSLTDLASAVTVGASLLLCGGFAPAWASWRRGLTVVSAAAGAWAVLASVTLVLSGADVAGLPLTHPGFGSALSDYATTVETGRLGLWALALAGLTAMLAAAARRPSGLAWVGVSGAVALVPTGLSGHAAGPGHEVVASAWWLHALGASVWVGGLLTLLLLRPLLTADNLAAVAGRYSATAGWAYALVAFTGVAGAIPRLDGWAGLLTGYGAILAAKAVLLIGLGVAGWWHRRRILPELANRAGSGTQRAGTGADRAVSGAGAQRAFWRLAGVEVVAMGAAFGLAAALSRTAPPADALPSANPTPAEVVTGQVLPPQLSLSNLITQVSPDVLWMVVTVALAVGYARLAWRLHRRGDRWPVGRTICWFIGCVLLAYVTLGGVAVYGRVLFSMHMVGHMVLSMVVPPFLVFGAPLTLVLRGCTPRLDGSRGPREWLLIVMESRFVRLVSHPMVAAGIFTLSLVAFYFSPLFGLALTTHLGHELMMIHFLLAGYLFVFALAGVDPAPVKIGYPLKLLLLFITVAFHAFFSIALMSMDTLLQATFFSSLGWGIDALADQRDGGAIAWAVGDGPTLLLALVVGFQWARNDDRLARRNDRRADLDGDAELHAYNDMLAGLRDHEPR